MTAGAWTSSHLGGFTRSASCAQNPLIKLWNKFGPHDDSARSAAEEGSIISWRAGVRGCVSLHAGAALGKQTSRLASSVSFPPSHPDHSSVFVYLIRYFVFRCQNLEMIPIETNGPFFFPFVQKLPCTVIRQRGVRLNWGLVSPLNHKVSQRYYLKPTLELWQWQFYLFSTSLLSCSIGYSKPVHLPVVAQVGLQWHKCQDTIVHAHGRPFFFFSLLLPLGHLLMFDILTGQQGQQ